MAIDGFFGCNTENETIYGKQSIAVNKITGEQTVFYLPDEENFKLLDKATEIQAPKEYRFSTTSQEIIKKDGCTYYKFTDFNKIGKYDPAGPEYYILNDKNEWEISSAVMRWVHDAAYDYIILDSIDEV